MVSLAVHNVLEGLAVTIVLLPHKVSKATVVIWCVVTLLPQALMTVLVFLFVHSFLPLLPLGLGFAGGNFLLVCGPVASVAIRPRDSATILVVVPVLREARTSGRAVSLPCACQSCRRVAPVWRLCH